MIGLALLRLRWVVNLITSIVTGLYILASMSYQLDIARDQIIQKNVFVRNCSEVIQRHGSIAKKLHQ